MRSIQRLRRGGGPWPRATLQTSHVPKASSDTPTRRSIAPSTEAGTFSANRITTTPSTSTITVWPSAYSVANHIERFELVCEPVKSVRAAR